MPVLTVSQTFFVSQAIAAATAVARRRQNLEARVQN